MASGGEIPGSVWTGDGKRAYILNAEVPEHPRGWRGFKARRACRKHGGHWWIPADAMIAWKCRACGAERDGMPKDGS